MRNPKKRPILSPRKTAFLLIFSMLLSVFTVFPSFAEGSGEIIAPPIPDTVTSDEITTEPSVIETEPIENEVAVTAAISTPVRHETANTLISAYGIDISVGGTSDVWVTTELTTAQSVTFTSSNPSVASFPDTSNTSYIVTVQDGGAALAQLTALRVGVSTITATVNCSDNTTETVSIEVYVVLDDGIYVMSNVNYGDNYPTYGTYYLQAKGTDVRISTEVYNDSATYDQYRYWKFEYLGNNEYAIRSWANTNRVLSKPTSAPEVMLATFAEGSSIPNEARWIISSTTTATPSYIIKNKTDSAKSLCPPLLTEPTHAQSDYVYAYYYAYTTPTFLPSENMQFEFWTIVPGIVIKNKETPNKYYSINTACALDKGTVTLDDLGYELVTCVQPSSIVWSSSNTSVATVSSGTITLIEYGSAIITATITVNSVAYSVKCTLQVVPIENGVYFLRNLQTGMYADIENNSLTVNNEIEQQTFDGASTQKWKFVYHSEGNVYTIRSESNNSYYLGLQNDSTATSTNIVLRNAPVTSGMKWRVTKGNQGYKISAYGNSSRVVYTDSFVEGENLTLATWTNDTNYQDEWGLHRIDYTINLDVKYDNAYLNRYPDAIDRLNGEIRVLQQKYLLEFGIWVNCSAPNIFESYADAYCSAPWNQKCTHGFCCNSTTQLLQSYHHKNIYNILLRVDRPVITQTFRMVYIGHLTCTESDNHDYDTGYYGLAYPSLGLMSITNFVSISSEIKTMIHELGHMYGAPDHSGIGDDPTTGQIENDRKDYRFDRGCIYGEDKEKLYVLNSLTICDGCKAEIESNRSKFNHNS